MIAQGQFTITDLFDGASLYTWTKYADDNLGTNMSDSPTGKKYIGFAYNKTTATESTIATDYSWSLISDVFTWNMIKNSGIKTDSTGWTLASGVTRDATFKNGDYGTFKYDITGLVGDQWRSASPPQLTITGGTKVSASAEVYIPTGHGIDMGTPTLEIQAWDSTGTRIGTVGKASVLTKLDQWQRLEINGYTLPANAVTANARVWLQRNGKLWVSKVKLEPGETAFSYTMHPDDLIGVQGPQGLQGLQGPKGDQGLQGNAGTNGTSSYTHIAYATNSTGTAGFSLSDPTGKTYIGMYVDSIATDSTDPTKYKWSLIKGADGAQGIPGTPGTNGQTPYLHIAYATNSTGTTGFSITDPVGKTYIGQYTDFVQNDSTDPAKYKWTLIKGADGATGPQGPQGIQGPAGTNGTSQYVHIRYSANADGSGFTTTPQANTVYVGLANTTSPTAPTLNTGYTWSNFKGPTGSQGIQGPAGANGVTTYTWVKYADDVNGSGMVDTPSGKKYIGLAFNKTTATESTLATDYSWSPLYDNVTAGSRNMIRKSIVSQQTVPFTNISNQTGNFYQFYPVGLKVGDIITITFDIEYDSLVASGTGTKAVTIQGPGGTTGWTNGTFPSKSITSYIDWVAGSGVAHVSYQATIDANHLLNEYIWMGWRVDYLSSGTITIGNARITRSNIEMDWSPAPEDLASSDDMDQLGELISSVSAVANAKAGMGEIQAIWAAYNERLTNDIADKEKLAQDLANMDGRVALATTIAGDAKLVTEFIDTVITQADEGIYIANKASSTGILISDDRISFMDNNVEVAFINNQTMQINHGIFVESATIANFHFEAIPGTTILAITWVGD